jgi:hypothetical protein
MEKGKWSQWISNVGNTDWDRPKDYNGRLDCVCEVEFGDTARRCNDTISTWNWTCAIGEVLSVGVIVKYRYWIPEEDTSWTEEDQKELERLEQKRRNVTEAQDKALKEVLQSIEINSQQFIESRINSAKHHAKQLIEALKPFVKD